jgi:NADP-dependent aldehyde dehydrogenase
MTITGHNFIGFDEIGGEGPAFQAYSTGAGTSLDPQFREASEEQIDRAVALAAAAAPKLRVTSPAVRAQFLEGIADALLGIGNDLIARASAESALPVARLNGELQRTVNQLRMFASVVTDGGWVDAVIDTSLPDRKPLPRPDLRRMLVPVGPVAVFGASNFPLAFSVCGGDTASALAAGCPVIVKAHPAHPGTSELAARVVIDAARQVGLPDGVFSMVHGGVDAGAALVRHPELQSVAFTGSHAAGRALCDIAAARPRPIPVFAEMGSVNPVFLLPDALSERGAQIAAGLAQSFTLGVGQFCTNPGIVVAIGGTDFDAFVDTLRERTPAAGASMLTQGIARSFERGKAGLAKKSDVRVVTGIDGTFDEAKACVTPIAFCVDAKAFLADRNLSEEVFGPSTMIVTCADADELRQVAAAFDGQLTATLHGTTADLQEFADIAAVLASKAGRLIFNEFPTGVEVCAAMQHGGPYPATSDSRFTSVGTSAIRRFARPVCWQNAPDSLLPPELQNGNPLNIRRMIDNRYTIEPIG